MKFVFWFVCFVAWVSLSKAIPLENGDSGKSDQEGDASTIKSPLEEHINDLDNGTTTTRNPMDQTTAQENIDSAIGRSRSHHEKSISETSVNLQSLFSVEQARDFKTVCYAPLRREPEPFPIDTSLCTHIIFESAVLDEKTLKITISEDVEMMVSNQLRKIKENTRTTTPKVLIALGGWDLSESEKYSKLVNDPNKRKDFIYKTLVFMTRYGFDGLDLKWQYPKCWLNNCSKGPASDKSGFAALIEELHHAFELNDLLLSAYVSPVKSVIDAAYDVPAISHYLDWINVMTYNFHGYWDGYTGHVAPLYDTKDYFNVDHTINNWISKGADPKKLLMGIPMYAQTFTLKDDRENGIRAPTKGPGTFKGDTLPFNVVCRLIQSESWTVVLDQSENRGPYAYKYDQWISYDDESQMIRKAKYIKDKGLGGAMVNVMTDDDMAGRCRRGSFPLLRALNSELRGI